MTKRIASRAIHAQFGLFIARSTIGCASNVASVIFFIRFHEGPRGNPKESARYQGDYAVFWTFSTAFPSIMVSATKVSPVIIANLLRNVVKV